MTGATRRMSWSRCGSNGPPRTCGCRWPCASGRHSRQRRRCVPSTIPRGSGTIPCPGTPLMGRTAMCWRRPPMPAADGQGSRWPGDDAGGERARPEALLLSRGGSERLGPGAWSAAVVVDVLWSASRTIRRRSEQPRCSMGSPTVAPWRSVTCRTIAGSRWGPPGVSRCGWTASLQARTVTWWYGTQRCSSSATLRAGRRLGHARTERSRPAILYPGLSAQRRREPQRRAALQRALGTDAPCPTRPRARRRGRVVLPASDVVNNTGRAPLPSPRAAGPAHDGSLGASWYTGCMQ